MNKVFIYGTGETAKKIVHDKLGNDLENIEFFDREKRIVSWANHMVCGTLDDLATKWDDSSILILASMSFCDMRKQFEDVLQRHQKKSRDEQFLVAYIYSTTFIQEISKLEVIQRTKEDIFNGTYQKLSNYFQDTQSKMILNAHIDSRLNGGYVRLLPYTEVNTLLHGSNNYWMTTPELTKQFNHAIVLEGGAYQGESIEQICTCFGHVDTYYAFEPNEKNIPSIQSLQISKNLCNEVIPMPYGMSNTTGKAQFVDMLKGDTSYIIESSDRREADFHNVTTINLMKIDDLQLQSEEIFIKMDIEGSELNALCGAEHTIRTYKPGLAICLYHKLEDLTTIPLMLKEWVPEYKLYLRCGAHTTLIATTVNLS